MFEDQNHGVEIKSFSPMTFTVQGLTGIEYVANCNNWFPHSSTPELQWGMGGDKLNCVTYANLQAYETYGDWLIATGKMPSKQLKFLQDNGYIDENGKINFSERFSSILNGTTKTGNSEEAVLNSCLEVGLIPESMLPSDNSLTWDQYYNKKDITQEMYDLGKKFLKLFYMPYEIVLGGETVPNDNTRALLAKHVQQAPLVIFTPMCPVWGTDDPLMACGKTQVVHATLLLSTDQVSTILDHYKPFFKHLEKNYVIPFAFKTFLDPIMDELSQPLHAKPFTLLKKKGESSMYFYGMDKKWHGLGDPDVRETFSGPYDPSKTIRVDVLPSNVSFTIEKAI